MKNIIRLSLLGVLLCSDTADAQKVKTATPGRTGMYAADVEFDAADLPQKKDASVMAPDATGRLAEVPGMSVMRMEKDGLGQEHIRYQQSHNGIPVENAIVVVHAKGGRVLRQNGPLVSDFRTELAATPAISEAAALDAALKDIGASVYKWQVPEEEAFLKREQQNPAATYQPKGELVYYSGEQEVDPAGMRLAYKFDIYARQPVSREIVFVDAVTGRILGRRNLIMHSDVLGFAQTAYSGQKGILTDSYNGSFRLRETGRGNGIETYNMHQGANYDNAQDFTDADNAWNNVNANLDQYATDAHWGAERTWDYFHNKFNRNSIDNAGYKLRNYVHTNIYYLGYSNNINAFWDGSKMTYGDGGQWNANTFVTPLTAIDIIGHEITHGLTGCTSGLVYSFESGALNEGFSDIFGTCIEFFAKGGDWTIGEETGKTFRNMANPKQFYNPSTYKGQYWDFFNGTPSTDNDYGGVHNNSGVLNYWFYLLAVGGSGTNDNNFAYTVNGITLDKAAAIAFRTNTVYLTPTSDYSDARIFSIKAAEDLYGVNSNEVTQVKKAWEAVGVSTTISTGCNDYEGNESLASADYINMNVDVRKKIISATDVDYFKFSTTNADPKIRLFLNDLPADYDVSLYNAGGNLIATSQLGSTAAETITYNLPTTASTYYVKVYGYNGANNNYYCYTLHVSGNATNWFGGNGTTGPGQKEATAATALHIYPVPAADAVNVSFVSEAAGSAELTLASLTGAVLKSMEIRTQAGTNQQRLDISTLPNGIYLLQLKNAQSTAVQKVVVQH